MRRKTKDTIPILTEKTCEILNALVKSRTLPVGLVQRAQIILLSAKGVTNQQIGAKVNLHPINVATWRNRFLNNILLLGEIENASPEKLYEKIVSILSDESRPGVPPKFTAEQILKIVDLACKSPGDFDYEVSQWSLNLLVKEIKKEEIADEISAKTVSRFLKYGRSQTT